MDGVPVVHSRTAAERLSLPTTPNHGGQLIGCRLRCALSRLCLFGPPSKIPSFIPRSVRPPSSSMSFPLVYCPPAVTTPTSPSPLHLGGGGGEGRERDAFVVSTPSSSSGSSTPRTRRVSFADEDDAVSAAVPRSEPSTPQVKKPASRGGQQQKPQQQQPYRRCFVVVVCPLILVLLVFLVAIIALSPCCGTGQHCLGSFFWRVQVGSPWGVSETPAATDSA